MGMSGPGMKRPANRKLTDIVKPPTIWAMGKVGNIAAYAIPKAVKNRPNTSAPR
jgi:hypothetical protein